MHELMRILLSIDSPNGADKMNTAQESAVTAISMHIGTPITLIEAQRLTTLWDLYFAAAVAYYGNAA